jgi:Bacterial transglutaminase-like cysteine proteinase BTLCP
MIAEIIPEIYDATGRQVSQPFSRRKGPRPTFPIGRYVNHPLTVACNSMQDVRRFLIGCEYVSDQELFGKNDYWQPPEEFEQRKKGDCEDFALWTWRQLLAMGYEARFIGGSCGRYGDGHAWVEYSQSGKWFLLEPLYSRMGGKMPRLSTWKYVPQYSVSWDGQTLRYFSHKRPQSQLGWKKLIPLLLAYLAFWTWFWSLNFVRLPQIIWGIFRRRLLRRDLWRRPKVRG